MTHVVDPLDTPEYAHWLEPLLPRNPTVVNHLCKKAGIYSEQGFLKRHIAAPCTFGAATTVAYIEIPVLVIHGVSSFLTGIVRGEVGEAFYELGADFVDAVKSLIFAAIGTFYVFATLFFPGALLSNFATMEIIEQKDLQAEITRLEGEIQEHLTEIQTQKRLVARGNKSDYSDQLERQVERLRKSLAEKETDLITKMAEINALKLKPKDDKIVSEPIKVEPVVEPTIIVEPIEIIVETPIGDDTDKVITPESIEIEETVYNNEWDLKRLKEKQRFLKDLFIHRPKLETAQMNDADLQLLLNIDGLVNLVGEALNEDAREVELSMKINGVDSSITLDLKKEKDIEHLIKYVSRATVSLEKYIDFVNNSIKSNQKDDPLLKSMTTEAELQVDGTAQVHSIFNRMVTEYNHPSKALKYHHVLTQIKEKIEQESIGGKKINLEDEYNHLNTLKGVSTFFSEAFQVVQILCHPEECQGDPRALSSQFVTHLRAALETPQYNKFRGELLNSETALHTARLLRKISYVRFGDVVLYPYLEQVVTLGAGQIDEELTPENFWTTFHEKNSALHHLDPTIGKPKLAKYLQQIQGHLGLYFDPLANVNTPYLRSQWSFKHTVTGKTVTIDCLRHGTPTEQGGLLGKTTKWLTNYFWNSNENHASIIPEYIAYVEESKTRNEKIFHFIHEKKQELSMLSGDESERVKVKMELAEQYPDHYTALAFPMDNDFFKWAGKFDRASKALTAIRTYDDLKERFVDQMFDKNSDFQLPTRLYNDAFKQEVKDMADLVHTLFFGNASGMVSSLDRYQAFQLLLQAHIKFHLLFRDLDKNEDVHLQIKSICKDAIDRGNIAEAIQELYLLLMLGKEEDADELYKLIINTLAPPYLVKKQGVLDDRAIFLKYVSDIIFNLKAEQKEALRAQMFNGWKASDMTIPDAKDQKGLHERKLGMTTAEEYNKFIGEFCKEKDGINRIKINEDVVLANASQYLTNDKKLDKQRILAEIGLEKLSKIHETGTYEEDRAFMLLCSYQPKAADDLLAILKSIFNNRSLGMQVVQEQVNFHVTSAHIKIEQTCMLKGKFHEDHATIRGVTLINTKDGLAEHRFIIENYHPL